MRVRLVVMCGGIGTRLWPLSRESEPKQFLRLFSGKSLFQKTLERCQSFVDEYCIISNAEQALLAKNQFKELNLDADVEFIEEPSGKNTAAVVALASQLSDESDCLLIIPSDHWIENQEAFQDDISKSIEICSLGSLVLIGIQPNSPHTGYGYIKYEGNKVLNFLEKPNLEIAQKYLNEGGVLWNSGMVCAKAKSIKEEFLTYCPDIWSSVEQATTSRSINPEKYKLVRAESFDTAVLEKTDNLRIIPAQFSWNDLGSYSELTNVLRATSNELLKEPAISSAFNNTILSRDRQKQYFLMGLENITIVDTPDAMLLSKGDPSGGLKEAIEKMPERSRSILKEGNLVHRPWGTFETIYEMPGHKVKKIVVYPGQKISLQTHKHRSEHWTVVKGQAKITLGKELKVLDVDQSIYIPKGDIHRMECISSENLEIIEVQIGDYLGEDDIVRIEDIYGR